MPNPSILPRDMTLYSAAEPKGRLFLRGDQWPGDAWSDKPGGEPAGAKTAAAALEDMEALRGQVSELQAATERLSHDLAQAAKDRDEAAGKLAEAEQRAKDAETAWAEAEAVAAEVTAQRDQLASVETDLRGKLAEAEAKIEVQAAEIAKVDGDGDGKVGGRKPKAKSDEDGGL